jgi:hypothetical protein
MAPKPSNDGLVDKMRAVQINPVIIIVVALVIVAGLGYFVWLRPEQEANRIKQEWSTPEAAKARSPEGRKADPTHEALVESLRQKEGINAGSRRR